MNVLDYRKKVKGCFIGKSVGGTLGMPYEGDLRVNDVTYYNPVPSAMVANDDLDLQVIALEIIRRRGLPVTSRYLSDMWLDNVTCYPDEYGVANKNVAIGLYPPMSGWYVNKFNGGEGAAIRSELWACLAPGDPDLAVKLAREDAATDHYSDGVDACLFLTAVESAAFVESDMMKLIDTGLKYIKLNKRMSNAFTDTIKWWNAEKDPLKVRSMILENYPSQNWTDVTINLSLIILSWLAGEGDFSKCICMAASLGYDADCTTATLGAILGLIDIDSIEEKWTWPIGDALVLSDNICGMHEKRTIGEFCEQILETCVEIQRYYGSVCSLEGDIPKYAIGKWTNHPETVMLTENTPNNMSIVAVKPIVIKAIYPEKVGLITGEEAKYTLIIENPLDSDISGTFALHAPDEIIAKGEGRFTLAAGEKAEFDFTVLIPETLKKRSYLNPLDILLEVSGIPFTATMGLVPPISWLADGKIADMPSNLVSFDEGAHTFTAYFKADLKWDNVRMTAQGTRPMKVYINDELVTEHDDEQYVPAFHRCKDGIILNVAKGKNKLTVEVLEGDNKPGEFFFGFAGRYSWQWMNEIEWYSPIE